MRAASVKYANSSEFTSLSQKLDYLFNKHLSPMVGKNKAKSPDEEVSEIFERRKLDAQRLLEFKYNLPYAMAMKTEGEGEQKLNAQPILKPFNRPFALLSFCEYSHRFSVWR